MIRFEKVSKRYGNGSYAVDNLDLQVDAGELCVLVGPSGGGKTTVLRMVNRLVEPTSGKVLVDGKTSPPSTCRAAPPDGLRDPAAGPFPSFESRRQCSLRAPAARLGPRPCTRPRFRPVGPGRPRPRRIRRSLPAPALGRAGTARRRRPRPGRDPPVLLMDEPFGPSTRLPGSGSSRSSCACSSSSTRPSSSSHTTSTRR